MMSATIQTLIGAFAGVERISEQHAEKLIALLEGSNNEALLLLYRHRVRFCWTIARRILQGRGVDPDNLKGEDSC